MRHNETVLYLALSAFGYGQTFQGPLNSIRITPESTHNTNGP